MKNKREARILKVKGGHTNAIRKNFIIYAKFQHLNPTAKHLRRRRQKKFYKIFSVAKKSINLNTSMEKIN